MILALAIGLSAQANATVVNSLPYKNTPDWLDIVFSGTSMTTNGETSALTTTNVQGVFFGWGQGYSSPNPSWNLGSNTSGNYLSLTASFSEGAMDWTAYIQDGVYRGYILFNSLYTFYPTQTCPASSCYDLSLTEAQQGITFYHAEKNGSNHTFYQLDLSQEHTFEFLVKGNQVAYRVDGRVLYAGDALATSSRIMAVGDVSGSTHTGRGSMYIDEVYLDTAPSMNTLISAVPEPETYALMLAGLGLVGFSRLRLRHG
jgi:hypothetical protein